MATKEKLLKCAFEDHNFIQKGVIRICIICGEAQVVDIVKGMGHWKSAGKTDPQALTIFEEVQKVQEELNGIPAWRKNIRIPEPPPNGYTIMTWTTASTNNIIKNKPSFWIVNAVS